ncbi:P-type conjugative transfer ATPase TrbB [Megamonas funiformis]|jgi:P-type conjugative transfer ATPase TrbB|uniref:P-type conjugative transfer ATPase TrbB n=1 Tax=Megamonas funiformis TaxID=437897 RepID=UPI00267187F2|nr:P-type conjugative transfer ATPase TrbB [Megamonas funiformis]
MKDNTRFNERLDFLFKDIKPYLVNDDVCEIMVNDDSKIWIDTFSKGLVYTGKILTNDIVSNIIVQIANHSHKICNKDNPLLEAEILNMRFQGFLSPDIVKNSSFCIRKHAKKIFNLDDYVHNKTMTKYQKEIIIQAIYNRKNIIVAGGTGSGKTTLVNALLFEIAKLNNRIIIIEDTKELKCDAENKLALISTKTTSMEDLLRATLRSRPDRIIVGEVRGSEAFTLINAWSTGHKGGISTVHSNSAFHTLTRIETLVGFGTDKVQPSIIVDAIDVIIYIKKTPTGRVIEEIRKVITYDKKKEEYITEKLA